ncbi:plastocyanin/azurin family copper-binding protein [Salinirubellus salinus]|uniref:Plastocyanin/azurin family copper-binding protein n=1 Tax=Salinirubellus salinus TaxID=1364945 RepID=A0A9E7U8S4_9EURY|nr:plastocyanin/azurin family copper-binding protein [Salinirubellus salinus]UWM55141.1 plastocyanin/azurin family copper-binding protein [Salinirubellus salinus]
MTDDQSRRRFLSRRAIALAGVMALAGCTSGGNGNGGGDDGPTPSDEPTATATDSGGSNADHTVVVGPAGSLVFDPAELAVAPGDTVQFSWESNFHTVTVESAPSASDWTGTGEETQDAGYTHTHTFEVTGTYDYYCNPHRGSGMVGSITVGDADGGSGDSGGGDDPY